MESRFEKWLNNNAVLLSGIVGLGFLTAGANTIGSLLSGRWSAELSVTGFGLGFVGIALGADALCQAFSFYRETAAQAVETNTRKSAKTRK